MCFQDGLKRSSFDIDCGSYSCGLTGCVGTRWSHSLKSFCISSRVLTTRFACAVPMFDELAVITPFRKWEVFISLISSPSVGQSLRKSQTLSVQLTYVNNNEMHTQPLCSHFPRWHGLAGCSNEVLCLIALSVIVTN